LREALKVLSREGLITLSPNRGAQVAVTTVEDVRDLFPIIGALETLAAELACKQVTELQIESLQLIHDEMVECYRKGDAAGYADRNIQIHNIIFHIADNPHLTQLYMSLNTRTHAVRYVARKAPEDWSQAVADHEVILEALRNRNGEQLGKILRDHLARKAEVVINFIRSQGV
jgi:DNA-binding GntR family transcriptional regulator